MTSKVPFKSEKPKELPSHVPSVRIRKNGNLGVLTGEIPMYAEQPGEAVPKKKNFEHFTHDKTTLTVMKNIASAVMHHEPCLLEGHTAASKTSSIEYLASMSNTPCYRLNLNGQTDTSELIGKFVPNDGMLQLEFEEALKNPHLLSQESKQILTHVQTQNRALTQVECQKIAGLEGIKAAEWIWKDGVIPHAMKHGGWVILDEMNLAEAQVLERLNPVLEKHPSLTLSENGGLVLGGSAHPVHPTFRIFGTMNPAEYTGRLPLSPAYKDRWQSYMFVETPGREEYHQMLRLMTFGEQPKVQIDEIDYTAEHVSPLYPTLSAVPNIHLFLPVLAQFHSDMATKAEKKEFGKDTKERLVFTRRTLLSFMDYLDKAKLIDPRTDEETTIAEDPKRIILEALKKYYVDKIRTPEDKKKVQDLLSALKLTREKWGIDFTSPEVVKQNVKKEIKQIITPSTPGDLKDALPDSPLEQELRLREQYITGLELLRKKEGLLRVKDPSDPEGKKFMNIPGMVGIVEPLSDGREGYKAIDGKEYPVPTYAMLQDYFRRRCEQDPVFRRKFVQQYKHGIMLPVPKGAILQSFVESCESTIMKCSQEGKLASGEQTILSCPRKDTFRGIWLTNEYSTEGKNNEDGGVPDETKLLYAPTYENGTIVGGKTKEEYLKDSTFPGWDILFLEQDLTIPAADVDEELRTKEGRTRLKADETPLTYMRKLQEEDQYAGERGMTPEEYLLLVQTIAATQGKVIDDYNNGGKVNYLTGARFVSGRVPDGCWDQDDARMDLAWNSPASRNDVRGFRPAVKM